MSAFDDLYRSIQTRPRPEDVAQLVLEILDKDLTAGQKRTLDQAARYSFKRHTYAYSSMANDFARVSGAERQVSRTAQIFNIPDPPSTNECLEVALVEAFMLRVAQVIQVVPGAADFKHNRLNREERQKAGIEIKKRRYNKMFRAIRRLEAKISRMVVNSKKYEATRISKSAGATKVTLEDLQQDLDTACFVAYLSARMNLRSMFTNTSQVQAFDEIAQMLFNRAKNGRNPNWWAMALVHPEKEVLKHLSEEEKGKLLGMWTETLHMLSDMLRDLDRVNRFDLTNCIVHKGNDSTTWNAVAGAWNKARDHWMSLLSELKMEHILEHFCPGKVLRLMASDVVRWQVITKAGFRTNFDWKNQALIDQGLHPDTLVFRELPKPWEVFQGVSTCTRAQVVAVCRKVYGDEMQHGWAGPKPDKKAATFTPTPELVHGVTVSSPYLASVLKNAGWFSGKTVKDPNIAAEVIRDPNGGIVMVNPAQASGEDENHMPPVGPSNPGSGDMAEPEASV